MLIRYCQEANVIFFQFAVARYSAIHQEAPDFIEMSVQQEILETGIKVVDLLAPYAKGGKIGEYLFLGLCDCFFVVAKIYIYNVLSCCFLKNI